MVILRTMIILGCDISSKRWDTDSRRVELLRFRIKQESQDDNLYIRFSAPLGKKNSRHTRTVTNHTSIPESVGWRKFFRTRSQAEGSNAFTKTNSCKAAVIERTLTLPESWAVCAQFTLVSGWHKYKQNKKSLYNVFSLQSNLLLIIDHVQTVQSSIPQSGLWPAFAPTRSIFYQ